MPELHDFDLLTLPGWHNSGADHWQTRWEQALPNLHRVEQDDWDSPVYNDWAARLGEAVTAAQRPVILVAHSLGTSLATRWAITTGGLGVAGAFLVATTDRDRWDGEPGEPVGFGPMLLEPLPFPSLVLSSTNDPRCTADRSQQFSEAWRARFIDVGMLGHIGSAANLGDWPDGIAWLRELAREAA